MTAQRFVDIEVPRDRATWGTTDIEGKATYYKSLMVDSDGSVWAWDEVGDCYTRHHDLTESEVLEALRRARTRVQFRWKTQSGWDRWEDAWGSSEREAADHLSKLAVNHMSSRRLKKVATQLSEHTWALPTGAVFETRVLA